MTIIWDLEITMKSSMGTKMIHYNHIDFFGLVSIVEGMDVEEIFDIMESMEVVDEAMLNAFGAVT